jgi:hypothetical protein
VQPPSHRVRCVRGTLADIGIVYERNQWESGEIYYFRSSYGKSHICQVMHQGDRWDVLFYRGPENLGPYHYLDFDKAKSHLMRYLRPREPELCGEVAIYGAVNSTETARSGRDQPLETSHPRHHRLHRQLLQRHPTALHPRLSLAQ